MEQVINQPLCDDDVIGCKLRLESNHNLKHTLCKRSSFELVNFAGDLDALFFRQSGTLKNKPTEASYVATYERNFPLLWFQG